ncbi:MAG: MBL fold metallo-hydrolase [Bacteroidales bacterium]
MEDTHYSLILECVEYSIYRHTNEYLLSNTYIIKNNIDNSCWIIDPGDFEFIRKYIQLKLLNLNGVFLTHVHFDHLYGLEYILKCRPDVLVIGHKESLSGISCSKRNLSRYYTYEVNCILPQNIKDVKAGDIVPLWEGASMDIYETPGHDSSCLSFYFNGCLFTGDAYIPGLKTITNLPYSNKLASETSVDFISSHFDKGTIVCPGHQEHSILYKINEQ